jgi:HK97 family phage major capsid protein
MLQLQDERNHAVRTAEDIIKKAYDEDDRALTEEEKTNFDEREAEVKKLDAALAAKEETEQRREAAKALADSLKTGGTRQVAPVAPNPDPITRERETGDREHIAVKMRYARLQAFIGPGAEERAYTCGQWVRAVVFGHADAQRWCTNRGMDVRAQSVAVNTAGGALVPDDFAQAIIDLRETYGVFRRECEVMPMGRDMIQVPRSVTDVTATFTGENASITEADQAFDNVTLVAKKIGTLTRVSSELAEDAVINIADYLARKMAYAFALLEDQCGFTGTGTAAFGSINGITNILNGTTATHTAGSVDAASGVDSIGQPTLADLNTLIGTLPEYALMNAKWYCSAVAKALVFDRLMAAGGGNTIQTLSGAITPTFLGYPVVTSQVLPTNTADTAMNNLSFILFGDLRLSSTLGDRRGISIRTSEDRYFEQDQIAIRATERFDINNHDLGDTSSAGPIVALVGNT